MDLQKIKELVLEETKRLYLEWTCDFSFFNIIGEITDCELDKYIPDDKTFHKYKNEVMEYCKMELEKL